MKCKCGKTMSLNYEYLNQNDYYKIHICQTCGMLLKEDVNGKSGLIWIDNKNNTQLESERNHSV